MNEGSRLEMSPTLTGGWEEGAKAWPSSMVGSGVGAKSARLCLPRCLSSSGFRILPSSGTEYFVPRPGCSRGCFDDGPSTSRLFMNADVMNFWNEPVKSVSCLDQFTILSSKLISDTF